MCGIFGIVSNEEVALKITLGIYDLQHRGEQALGMATSDGNKLCFYKETGLVTEVFDDEKRDEIINKLPGRFGIGHALYSTVGKIGETKQTKTFQPLLGNFHGETFALGHNGNLINLDPLRKEAEARGYQFQSKVSDTEVIVALISTSEKSDFVDAVLEVLPKMEGAFALVVLYKNKVIGIKDRHGIRPLCLGQADSGFILASEECAFHTLTGTLIRELRPGELIILGPNGIESSLIWTDAACIKPRFCIMELVYFARPDSTIFGCQVYLYRDSAGFEVATEHPVKAADFVSSVPESGSIYNYGVSRALNVPVRRAISRNRYYATRTFLTPRETDRKLLQRTKFYILKELVYGKIMIITEDSIVRGNVSPEVVKMLRLAGAAEVHLRIGSAPIRYPCFLGIDIPTQKELAAANRTIDQIRKEVVCVDSLGYLSLEGMIKSSGLPKENLCLGCFTGEYPVDPPKDLQLLIKPPPC